MGGTERAGVGDVVAVAVAEFGRGRGRGSSSGIGGSKAQLVKLV
jgi:hypothetical protein